MGLARKMKRAAVNEAAKKICRENGPAIKKSFQGEAIAKRNMHRIVDFCRGFYIPLFAWTLHKHFGFGCKRLIRMGQEFNRHLELVQETQKADEFTQKGNKLPKVGGLLPHHFLSIEDMHSDMKAELGYSYPHTKMQPLPKNGEVEDYARVFALNMSWSTLDGLKVVWLHTMWVTFGFGKKRLAECDERFRECLEDMSYNKLMKILAEMEEKISTRTEGLCFDNNRKILKRLGVDSTGDMGLLTGKERRTA